MTAVQYQEIREEFSGLLMDDWTALGKLAKLRLKRAKPEWLRAKLAAALLIQDPPVVFAFGPLWTSLGKTPFSFTTK